LVINGREYNTYQHVEFNWKNYWFYDCALL
jgi:hypothetical protein